MVATQGFVIFNIARSQVGDDNIVDANSYVTLTAEIKNRLHRLHRLHIFRYRMAFSDI